MHHSWDGILVSRVGMQVMNEMHLFKDTINNRTDHWMKGFVQRAIVNAAIQKGNVVVQVQLKGVLVNLEPRT